MAKVLVIPDVHLKPWIFDRAEAIMQENKLDLAVFIGDLVDDWKCEAKLDLYRETIERAEVFKAMRPNSLFCYGNHEVAYMVNSSCSGNSELFRSAITYMLNQYERIVEPKLVHIVDNVVFSHAGVESHYDIHKLEQSHNLLELYHSMDSPLWSRPDPWVTYKDIPQVIGHTPMKNIVHKDNLWFVDTFSTCSDLTPYGDQTFLVIDTIDLSYYIVS